MPKGDSHTSAVFLLFKYSTYLLKVNTSINNHQRMNYGKIFSVIAIANENSHRSAKKTSITQ